MPRVEIRSRGVESRHLEFEGRLLVGRGSANDLVLGDPRVSNHHALVSREPDGSWSIIDLGSRNGTLLSGVRVGSAALSEGIEVVMGDTLLRFTGVDAVPGRRGGRSVPEVEGESTEPIGLGHGLGSTLPGSAFSELVSICELCMHVDAARTERELLPTVGRLVRKVTGAEFVTIVECRPEEDRMVPLHVEPPEHSLVGDAPLSTSIVANTLSGGRPVVVSDAALSADYRHARSVLAHSIRAVLCVPLRGHDQVRGAIFLAHRDRSRSFHDREVRLLDVVGTQAGLAIEALRLGRKVRESFLTILQALVAALEARDGYTAGHSRRVAALAECIGRELHLPAAEMVPLRHGALLHDIGKIGVPDACLLVPRRLEKAEFALVQSHPDTGSRILRPLGADRRIEVIVRHHHERWDGRGYPDGLAGEDISLLARIVAVADTLDAISSDRPYRDGAPLDQAVEEVERHAGRQHDPQVVAGARRAFDAGHLAHAFKYLWTDFTEPPSPDPAPDTASRLRPPEPDGRDR